MQPLTNRVLRLPENKLGRDFAVGDIHGAYDSVVKALKIVAFDPAVDRLFPPGDLVDRGPGSYRCLAFLKQPYVHASLGNHEKMLIDLYADGVPDEDVINALCRMGSTGFNGIGWWKHVEPAVRLDIIEAFKRLPVAIEVQTARGVVGFVHADVPRGMHWSDFLKKIEQGDQAVIDIAIGLDDRSRDRLKYGDCSGVEGVGRLFVGHSPQFGGLRRCGNVWAIDTGAVFGEAGKKGHLTMANVLMATVELGKPADAISLIDVRNPEQVPTTPFTSLSILSAVDDEVLALRP